MNQMQNQTEPSKKVVKKKTRTYKEITLDILELLIMNKAGLLISELKSQLVSPKEETIGKNLHLLKKFGFVDSRKDEKDKKRKIWFTCLTYVDQVGVGNNTT